MEFSVWLTARARTSERPRESPTSMLISANQSRSPRSNGKVNDYAPSEISGIPKTQPEASAWVLHEKYLCGARYSINVVIKTKNKKETRPKQTKTGSAEISSKNLLLTSHECVYLFFSSHFVGNNQHKFVFTHSQPHTDARRWRCWQSAVYVNVFRRSWQNKINVFQFT